MDHKKVFLLGIGAQKCGTTWLEAQLAKQPFFSNGGVKEFHSFNKLHQEQALGKIARRKKSRLPNLLTLGEAMRLSPKLYFDHFDYLFYRDPNVSHVGDITPAYSTLSRKKFRLIKSGLESKQFKIKLVFLMRDPAERVWSQLRMNNRLQKERKNKPQPSADQEREQLKLFYKSRFCQKRTRYEKIITNIESIFNQECIYYGFYENLFQQAEISRLTDFLECPSIKPDFKHVVHASPKQEERIDEMDELLAEIRNHYSSTYKWIQDRFQDKVPTSWKTNAEH